MHAFNHEYEPFLRNGLLCLPEKTVKLMVDAGLNPQIAEIARRGLVVTEQKQVAAISDALRQLLGDITAREWQFKGWSPTEDTRRSLRTQGPVN